MNHRVSKRPRRYAALAMAAVAAVALAGCSTRADTPAATSEGGATGPGVTDTTISLGILSDLTGPFAGQAKSGLAGLEVRLDEANEQGGVCGRQVELVIRDHGYDPQKALTAYTEISGDVLGFAQIVGSHVTRALADQLVADQMVGTVMAIEPGLSDIPGIMIPITTVDVETINGLSWLLDEGVIKEGATIGIAGMEGSVGDVAIAGARFMAEAHGFTLVEQRFHPVKDTDLTAQAIAFADAGVDLIVLAGTVVQVVSLASVLESRGEDTPMLITHNSWDASAMKGDAVGALLDRVYIPSPMRAFSSDNEEVVKLREATAIKAPDEPGSTGVVFGSIMGSLWIDLLTQACADGDLTRESVLAALGDFSPPETGLSGPLVFDGKHKTPSATSFMNRPDADLPGGLREVTKEPFVSPEGQDYWDNVQ